MLIRLYQEYLQRCFEAITKSDNQRLRLDLAKLQQADPDTFESRVKDLIQLCLPLIQAQQVSEEAAEHHFARLLHQSVQYQENSQSMYIFKIVVSDSPTVWRRLQFPAALMLSDLCYAILSSMQSECTDQFSVCFHYHTYYSDPTVLDVYNDGIHLASAVPLGSLALQPGDCLSLSYGHSEVYEFGIELESIQWLKTTTGFADIRVLDGEGFGIWEDEKNLFTYYYHHCYEDFIQYAKYSCRALQDLPIDEDFDLEEQNRFIVQDTMDAKEWYENNADYDEMLEEERASMFELGHYDA